MGEATFLDSQRGRPPECRLRFPRKQAPKCARRVPSTVILARFLQANPSCVFAEVEQNDINWCLKRRSSANMLTSIQKKHLFAGVAEMQQGRVRGHPDAAIQSANDPEPATLGR